MGTSITSLKRVLCLSLLGISLTACTSERKKETASDAVPVTVGKAQHVEEGETIAVSGTVSTPKAPAKVAFLVSGRVIFVGPREGEYVKKGEVLARIDPTDFSLSREGAAAQLANAQAALDKAMHPARRETVEQARIALERAEDEHRRMKMLYDSKSLAPNDYEKYKAAYQTAQQQFEEAKSGAQREDKEVARAAYHHAAAQLRIAEKALSDATLRAPTSGYVAKRSIEPGDSAAAGVPVFEVVQMEPVEVNVGVPETDVHLVRIGQRADITVPALPGQLLQGTVRVINVSADPATRTYMTRITVPNPKQSLRVGMVAEATIRGDRTVPMVTLPGEAVIRDAQGATQVFVYYPDQKRVYAKRVETGAAVGKNIQIKSGLSGNELIVLGGQTRLRNGTPVSATEQQGDRP